MQAEGAASVVCYKIYVSISYIYLGMCQTYPESIESNDGGLVAKGISQVFGRRERRRRVELHMPGSALRHTAQ